MASRGAVERGVTVGWGGGRNREVRPGFLMWRQLGDALPPSYSPLRLSRTGVSVASEATAEPYCLEHNVLCPPPRGGGALAVGTRLPESACAVRAGRCLCDSGAAILSGGSSLRSSAPRSLPPVPRHRRRPRRCRSLLPSPSRTSRDRLGEERLASAFSSFSRPSPSSSAAAAAAPGSLCPPPSVGATSAGTRRRLLLLPLLPPPSPLPPSPLPLSATISPLPGTGALS